MDDPRNSELQSYLIRGRRGLETIILAGGLGTRLRSVVSDIPKCMAPVAGRPFLYHVIEHFRKNGIEKFIFSLGYMHEMITGWLKEQYPLLPMQFSIETEPLGTGGAVQMACKLTTEKNVLLINGDTLFSIELTKLMAFHEMCGADCTLSLKSMKHFDRYGVVELNGDQSIASFKEKQHFESGLINGGVYALNAVNFLEEGLPEIFSFEKDYLEKYNTKRRIFGLEQDQYFIDIGIPEDFERANKELANS